MTSNSVRTLGRGSFTEAQLKLQLGTLRRASSTFFGDSSMPVHWMPSESKNFASSPCPQPTSNTLNPTPSRKAANNRDMTFRGIPVCSSKSLDSALRRCQGDITHLPRIGRCALSEMGKVKGRPSRRGEEYRAPEIRAIPECATISSNGALRVRRRGELFVVARRRTRLLQQRGRRPAVRSLPAVPFPLAIAGRKPRVLHAPNPAE